MAGLEIPGFILGAASALAALRGGLDTALLINAYFDDEKSDCGYLALRYHIQKTRLDLWRQTYNINDLSTCPLRHKPKVVQELVIQILGQITQLLDQSKKLVKRHQIATADLPPNDANGAPQSQDAVVEAMSKLRVKPKSKFRWTIKGKAEFDETVSRISTLVDALYSFTVDASEARSLDRALPSMSLEPITSAEMLRTLHRPETNASADLAMSARVKLLQTDATQPRRSVTVITNDQLRFLRDSATLGTLRLPAGGYRSVWIEWSIISEGDAAPEYIRRIKALGYLLEEAGDPALHLPVCYGIFDDLAYETKYGARRIGYVFGAPQADQGPSSSSLSGIRLRPPVPNYDGNFRDHPPRTLSDLIRDSRSYPVPLLGDRFALAVALATAFGNFHSAGWLHKGFHSGNIVFLTQTSGREAATAIETTDPFITGFQYARPTGAHSLSQGPLEISELEHYYPPSADGGFSRRTDLYSLGVVLCEIGRWGLVADTVSQGTRRKLVDRAAWREYMVGKVLADIGWRMGEKYQSAVRTLLACRLPDDDEGGDAEDDDRGGGFFEQQYFEKVLQPLSACSA